MTFWAIPDHFGSEKKSHVRLAGNPSSFRNFAAILPAKGMADEGSAAAELQELTDDFFDVVGSEEGDFDVKDSVVYVAYEKGLTAP